MSGTGTNESPVEEEGNSVLQLIRTTVSGKKRTVSLFKLKGKLTEGPALSDTLKV
jgi:hypothetical protein